MDFFEDPSNWPKPVLAAGHKLKHVNFELRTEFPDFKKKFTTQVPHSSSHLTRSEDDELQNEYVRWIITVFERTQQSSNKTEPRNIAVYVKYTNSYVEWVELDAEIWLEDSKGKLFNLRSKKVDILDSFLSGGFKLNDCIKRGFLDDNKLKVVVKVKGVYDENVPKKDGSKMLFTLEFKKIRAKVWASNFAEEFTCGEFLFDIYDDPNISVFD